MAKVKLTIMFLGIMCCLLALPGCKDTEKENAVAEAAKAKAELANTQLTLVQTEQERDSLKSELAAVIKARDKLQDVANEAMNIKGQLSNLTKERDTAVTKAANIQDLLEALNSQLQAQITKANDLQTENSQLQATIKQRQDKLKDVKLPSVPQL